MSNLRIVELADTEILKVIYRIRIKILEEKEKEEGDIANKTVTIDRLCRVIKELENRLSIDYSPQLPLNI